MQVSNQPLDHIAELLDILFESGKGVAFVLSAYFDESARLDAGSIMCVAGYVFKPAEYERFCQQWREMLQEVKPGGVTALHMVDLCHGRKEFAGVPQQKRDDMLRSAVEIINAHIYTGIAVSFRQDEFESMAPANWPRAFGSIYSVACQLTLQVFAQWAGQHDCDEPVAYFFETGHRHQAEANALLDGVGGHPVLGPRFHYHSHSFVRKQDAFGLQAADILAWEWTKYYAETHDQRIRKTRESLKALILNDPSRYLVTRFQDDTLRRFMQEQISRAGEITVDAPDERRRTFR